MNIKDYVWTEKYRPDKVSNVVGDFREKVEGYLRSPNNVPNFLFYSKSPGTGKTTLAKAIIKTLDCDSLIINSSDERKIEVIREKVKEFCQTRTSKVGVKRCIFMDEADGMLSMAQDALRNMMETYSSNAFFILTANNINKIIEPIQSRCVVLHFSYPKKEEIVEYLTHICVEEKLQYTKEGIVKLVDINYPSIRNCVLVLQDLHTQKLNVTIDTVQPANYMYKQYWDRLKTGDYKSIQQSVMESSVDARELNKFFWEMALKEENIKLIQLCCRNERDISIGSNPVIIVVSSLIEMVK